MPITPKKYMNEVETQDLIFKIREALEAKPKIVTWADGTDEEIVALIEALDDGTYTTEDLGWDVGDERVVSLNAISSGTYNGNHAAQDVILVIMEVSDYNGVGHYIVGTKDCISGMESLDTSSTFRWNDSRGRKCCDALYDGMIPSTLKPIFKTFTVTTATQSGASTLSEQSCKMSLFAEKEVYDTRSNSVPLEFNSSNVHNQLEWHKTAANRKKREASYGICDWWLRSPQMSYSNYGVYAQRSGEGTSGSRVTDSAGFAPFLVI